LEIIEHDDIFRNNSRNTQRPIVQQLAIALYRLGIEGNEGSIGSLSEVM